MPGCSARARPAGRPDTAAQPPGRRSRPVAARPLPAWRAGPVHRQIGFGKTLAAHWMARRTGLPLYRVDLAAMTSKWIGETERSLGGARHRMPTSSCSSTRRIRSFPGRAPTSPTPGRFANAQTNYLLQRIEDFDASPSSRPTSDRFDPAFVRRSTRSRLPLPDAAARPMWRTHVGDGHERPTARSTPVGRCRRCRRPYRNMVLNAAIGARRDERRSPSPTSPLRLPKNMQARPLAAGPSRMLTKALADRRPPAFGDREAGPPTRRPKRPLGAKPQAAEPMEDAGVAEAAPAYLSAKAVPALFSNLSTSPLPRALPCSNSRSTCRPSARRGTAMLGVHALQPDFGAPFPAYGAPDPAPSSIYGRINARSRQTTGAPPAQNRSAAPLPMQEEEQGAKEGRRRKEGSRRGRKGKGEGEKDGKKEGQGRKSERKGTRPTAPRARRARLPRGATKKARRVARDRDGTAAGDRHRHSPRGASTARHQCHLRCADRASVPRREGPGRKARAAKARRRPISPLSPTPPRPRSGCTLP